MKMILVSLALICTYFPYGCEAKCNCLEIVKHKKAQWEYLMASELELGTSPDSAIIFYISGCCGAYAEVIDALERAKCYD